jgi:hypothetical protein
MTDLLMVVVIVAFRKAGPSTLHPTDVDLSVGTPAPLLRFGRSG